MPRRARWLQEMTSMLTSPYLLVDAGDSLAEPAKSSAGSAFLTLLNRNKRVSPKAAEAFVVSKADQDSKSYLAMLYKELGYNAIGVGAFDLPYLSSLQNSSSDAPVFVSANCFKDDKPAFTPYILKESGGMTVGITSVVGIKPSMAASWVELRDPAVLLKETLLELRKKADVVVVLANMSLNEARQIATNVSGIDLMVISGADAMFREAMDVNGVKIVGSDDKGRSIGEVVFNYDKLQKKYTVGASRLVLLDRTMPEDERFVQLVNEMH